MTLRNELDRLLLQIARDLAAQKNIETLLAAADATVAGHRRELRSVKARIKRGALQSQTE